MAYYDTILLVAGDDKPEINFTLRDSNTAATGLTLDPDDPTTWDPIDLTGTTILVKFRRLGESATLDSLPCTIQTAEDGTCYMPWNVDTLDVDAGTYEGEIEITFSDGRVMTVFDKMKFKIRDDFA